MPALTFLRGGTSEQRTRGEYERQGFYDNVVFTCGTLLADHGDTLSIYYSTADTVVCLTKVSYNTILRTLARQDG